MASRTVRLLRRAYSTSLSSQPTIFALSTPPGKSALAIIRISGPQCRDIYKRLSPSHPLPRPRHAVLRPIISPTNKQPIDPQALALYFPGPASSTGEDVLELHTHGGRAIIRAVLTALGTLGAVPAQPGEFTKRAFINGRLDLMEVEGLARILDAETEAELRGAVGFEELKRQYEDWRSRLVGMRARVEAVLDFAEDVQDVDSESEIDTVRAEIRDLREELDGHLRTATRGELLRDGISLSLLGPPNAGKSSLLNRLVGRDAAIVSSVPGTTRDVVDLAVDIGGYKVLIGDTAGLRASDDIIEQEGIRRAKERLKSADVGVLVLAVGEDGTVQVDNTAVEAANEFAASGKELLVVINKTDLAEGKDLDLSDIKALFPPTTPIIPLSLLSSLTLPLLPPLVSTLAKISSPLSSTTRTSPSLSLLPRHRIHLQNALDKFALCDDEEDLVFLAEHLREAAEDIGRVVGRYGEGSSLGVEEVLGNVFGRFCVGK